MLIRPGYAMVMMAVILAQARPASADIPFNLSVGAVVGGTTREHGRFAYGLRPEALYAPHHHGIAIGPYLELARSSGDDLVGGGLTATYYSAHTPFTIAPSVGAYHRFVGAGESGLAAGMFVGVRFPSGIVDLPFGLRFDWRGDADLHELVISAQIDLLAVAAAAVLSQRTSRGTMN